MATKLLYHLNGDLMDSSPSALSFPSQSALTFPSGKFGKGASGFGATNAIVSQVLNDGHMANLFIGADAIGENGTHKAWTMEVQLKLATGDARQTAFQITKQSGQETFWIKLLDNNYLQFGQFNNGLFGVDVTSIVNDGLFHHVAIIFRNKYHSSQMYIDGNLVATAPRYDFGDTGAEACNFPLSMTIGGGYSTYGYSVNAFAGFIDEFRLSDGAIYNGNFTPPSAEFTTGVTPPTSPSFLVRKNGSGTHTDIQSAIYDSADGDTIDIGAGTFDGNIELYKSVILKGAGKDQTFITGKLANDTFTNCSYYAGEDTITVASTAGLIKGRRVLGLTANSRISQIVSGTQFKVSLATPTTGNITKTGVTWSSGSSTITLPSVTAVVVGMKVEATGVAAFVSAYNTTTKVVTLSVPTTQAGSAASLLFKSAKSGITVTMPAQFTGSTFPATIQVMNVATSGLQIKDLTVTGFNGNTNTEAAAICMTTPVSSGVHQNWLVDNCKIVADGDCAFVTSPNMPSNGGTIQNCIFDGKTFTGSAPTEVPAFSSFLRSGVVLTTTTLEMPSVVGIYGNPAASVGSPISGTGIQSSTTVTAVNGMVITLSKAMTATVGSSVACTFSNVQFTVPNVARQLVVIGNSSSVSACINTTFKNNTISGQTGAVIDSNKSMFNNAVTIDTAGGLVENNMIDGFFGAGDPNSLVSNFAIRSRGAGVVVQNNVNKTSGGRGNSGYYIPNGTSTNNVTIDRLLIEASQSASNASIGSMLEKSALKAISKVSSDAVFSNEANWKLVSVIYKHNNSSRRLYTAFSDLSKLRFMKLKSSMVSSDKFELQKIIISTADRTLLVIKRSEIPDASGYDFTLK